MTLLRDYTAALLAHRISAHGMSMQPPRFSRTEGKLSVDFTDYEAEVAPFLEGKALPGVEALLPGADPPKRAATKRKVQK